MTKSREMGSVAVGKRDRKIGNVWCYVNMHIFRIYVEDGLLWLLFVDLGFEYIYRVRVY